MALMAASEPTQRRLAGGGGAGALPGVLRRVRVEPRFTLLRKEVIRLALILRGGGRLAGSTSMPQTTSFSIVVLLSNTGPSVPSASLMAGKCRFDSMAVRPVLDEHLRFAIAQRRLIQLSYGRQATTFAGRPR